MTSGDMRASAAGEQDALVGVTLAGSYRVVRVLGEGGMGVVYEAQHTRLGTKRFAIKTLHEELAHHAQVVARFRREAEAAAAIDSPHVVAVYDLGKTDDGRLFLVSELLEGVELGEYLQQYGRLPAPHAVRLVRQLCKALSVAHSAGVVHRDLKPENVFLTGDLALPTVKVLDFGIAKFDDSTGKALTKTGMIMGTPSFMAPEQARGERVDARVDVYGAGAILYAMLAGRAPFEGEPAGVLVQVMTGAPPPVTSVEPSVPALLADVLDRAMAIDREERYQEIGAFDADLAPFDPGDEAVALEGAALAAGSLRSAPTLVRRAEAAERQGHLAGAARREIIALFGIALAWGWLGLAAALAALLRMKRGGIGAGLSAAEALLMLLVAAVIVGPPAYVVARQARATRWDDAAKVTALSERLRAPVLTGAAVYGLATLLLRFSELLVNRSVGAAWPGWDLLLFAASAIAAALVAAKQGLQARRELPSAIAALFERPALSASLAALALATMFVLLPLGRGAPEVAAASGSVAPASLREMGALIAFEDAVESGRLEEAVSHLDAIAEDAPDALGDADLRAAAMELAMRSAVAGGAPADGTFALLSEDMGPHGIDLLYRLHSEKGGSKAAERATILLADEEVRARGSEALRIAYDLRHAADCGAVLALLERAQEAGDDRAIGELMIVASCKRRDRCCLEGDARVKEALAAMRGRLE